jgi:ABC-type antimicrobial peptide transport system permease subunit
MAARSMRLRGTRTLLTALTAAVAVATVFATRGLLRGSETALEADLHRLGVRTVSVVDGAGFLESGGGAGKREPLGPADVETARAAVAASGAKAEVLEARVRLGTARAADGKAAIPVPILETGPAYARTFEAEMVEGRFLEDGDATPDAPGVCVLDAETARALGGLAVGAEISLGEAAGTRKLRVVGVLSDPFRMRLSSYAPDMTASARRAIHQVLAFRNVYVAQRNGATAGSVAIFAVVEKREEAQLAHDAMERALRAKERGLLVWSRGTWVRNVVETASQQIEIANVIWAVVLAVALVMIATVTLVGVRERTAEVAVRRAQGATRAQVTGQLLAEGALTAAAGGLAGIPLGLLAADRLATLLTWRPHHSSGEALLAVGLGVLVGLLAAALPAWRAARWDVVEGLRRGA